MNKILYPTIVMLGSLLLMGCPGESKSTNTNTRIGAVEPQEPTKPSSQAEPIPEPQQPKKLTAEEQRRLIQENALNYYSQFFSTINGDCSTGIKFNFLMNPQGQRTFDYRVKGQAGLIQFRVFIDSNREYTVEWQVYKTAADKTDYSDIGELIGSGAKTGTWTIDYDGNLDLGSFAEGKAKTLMGLPSIEFQFYNDLNNNFMLTWEKVNMVAASSTETLTRHQHQFCPQ